MMEQEMGTSKSKASRGKLEVMHPGAAGIDVGGAMHFVAVPNEAAPETVRQFGVYTRDLHELADWLRACGVKIVAMESTGVYWIPLYELLESRGFEVMLVDARQVKNVSGRKSDVLDCQWLQQLLSYGLLKAAFRPQEQFCQLREFNRLRTRLLVDQGRSVQHMQKAMTLMNIQLSQAISDVAGVTGQKIVRAIVEGERDPMVLAAYRDSRIKASEEEIAASLQGTWKAEHLLALKQALGRYDFFAEQLAECDQQIERVMGQLQAHTKELGKGKKRSKAKNAPKFNLRERLLKMCGVDVTRIDGIDETTALNVVAEVGTDSEPLPERQALRLVARAVPRHAHQRWQGAGLQDQAQREPGVAGVQAGSSGIAQQQISAGRVLQATVRSHGQGQGRHGRGSQARPAVLRAADQGAGIRRPRPAVLRRTLP
jgi:transposase